MKPTAAPATWPYPGHRNMAEVMRDEERARAFDRQRYETERRSLGVGR